MINLNYLFQKIKLLNTIVRAKYGKIDRNYQMVGAALLKYVIKAWQKKGQNNCWDDLFFRYPPSMLQWRRRKRRKTKWLIKRSLVKSGNFRKRHPFLEHPNHRFWPFLFFQGLTIRKTGTKSELEKTNLVRNSSLVYLGREN